MAKLDDRTKEVIKLLRLRLREGKLNLVDKRQLAQLNTGERTIEDIENERRLCKDSYIYFINQYIYVKNKFDNPATMPDILKERCQGDMIKFVLYEIQIQLADAIFNDDKVISTKSRQIGFTTTTLACALQLLTFNNNKTVLLYSKTEKDAIAALEELKFMYDNLPFFLRRTAIKRNEKQLTLGNRINNSKIVAQTAGRQSGRSQSATQLIADEADYIEGIESIYKAALFTIAATKGKIIVLSTPNIFGSQFYKMIRSAKEVDENGNTKSGFTLVEGPQDSIPYRDEAQYNEQCEMLNQDKKSIATELDMRQILPYETYFDEDKILSIKQIKETNMIVGIVKQYYPQQTDVDHIISVDVQEEGEHYNAIAVYNLVDKRIEATCLTRANIFDTILELSKMYTNETTGEQAKVIIERNRGFYLLKKFEENGLNHLLLPNIKYIKKTDTYDFDLDDDGNPLKLGFVTSDSKRKKMLISISNYVYKNNELPSDLIDECHKFVFKRGKPVGLEHDDLILSVSIAIFYDEILAIAKEKSKGDKRLSKFVKSYQKNAKVSHVDEASNKITDINDQLRNIILRNHLILNDTNLSGLEFEILEKSINDNGGSSKMKKAMSGLLFNIM